MTHAMPLIGVTTYHTDAAWGSWRGPAAVVPGAYFELLAAVGARPVLLPPTRSAPGGPGAGAEKVAAALDALVLIGGGDVDPGRYGQGAHAETGGIDPDRDAAELALLAAALDADLPVLAICRGLQVLNVLFGGTLCQSVPDVVGHRRHQPNPGEFGAMAVATTPGTRLAGCLGPSATVRCSHHQAVDRLGGGLVVSARAVDDDGSVGGGSLGDGGLVEGIELPDRRFVVGVQWHPEESGDRRLFASLVAAVGVEGPVVTGRS